MAKALSVAIALALISSSCTPRIERRVGTKLETVDLKAAYLKAHLRTGEVIIFSRWIIDETQRELVGHGERQGPDRTATRPGDFRVRFDDVALFETNTVVQSPGMIALTVITGLSVAVSIACLTNPKACFGSCPTFYAADDKSGKRVLQAEGFSDSIAPSLEKNDVDALWLTSGGGGAGSEVALRMTNEAYETHVIKQADLLAVPRPAGGRVFSDGEKLWLAPRLRAAVACESELGSCIEEVRAVDGVERKSLTDAEDLAHRETVDVAFAAELASSSAGKAASGGGSPGRSAGAHGGERLAVVIGARQTLVTTFLLYQGLAYLGTQAPTWLAAMERGQGPLTSGRGLKDVLGGIEVQLADDDGRWQTVGELYETGPIATDVHLVMLPAGARAERVRLRMPQGGWRVDYVALASISGEAQPVRVAPWRVRGQISKDFGRGRAPADRFPITTLPGDEYELEYRLPAGPAGTQYELFLDSRGYYLEWMRKEWLGEERPLAALRMLLAPEEAMRELAPAFKKLEPEAEELFWRSRYVQP